MKTFTEWFSKNVGTAHHVLPDTREFERQMRSAYEGGEADAREILTPWLQHYPSCRKVLVRSKFPYGHDGVCSCGLDKAMGVQS
jgi:hypothetical protein